MATTQLNKDPKEPAYRRFVPDQVLTALQLNDVIDHFEIQDRFTRVALSGVGIACGLEVVYDKNKSIQISKGCAVSTDGDLVSFAGATYTHAKIFIDVEAKYPHFNGVNLLELIPAEASENSGVKALDKIENMDSMVVVLYLEYFSKKETPCASSDCDTQGEGQLSKIRMLLISNEDVKRISNKDNDSIFDAYNKTKKWMELPNVNIKKIVLKNSYIKGKQGIVISQDSNTANFFRLQDSYRKAMDTNVISDLKDGINKLFTDFNTTLNTETIATKATTINNNIDVLFTITSKNLPLDIQYRYGLLKDLVDTYNEIKSLLFDLKTVCCPNISAFPKHLLLGELNPIEIFVQYRHSFYPSPIIPHGNEKLEELRSLMLRIHFMLKDYNIPQSISAPIKVTPSKVSSKKLGKRALPYYYVTSKQLIENWDYSKTKKFKATENLGYQTTNLSENDAIQNPLDYALDDFDFYRIEGHLGKDYREAIRRLDEIKTEKGLAFDIKVLSIDETIEDINTNDYDCEFEDLNAVLKAWRAEQNCLNAGISKFFSGFSLKNQGEHKFYKLSKLVTAEPNEPVRVERASDFNMNTGRIASLGENKGVFGSSKSMYASYAEPLNINFGKDTKLIRSMYNSKPGLKLTYNLDTVVSDNLEKDEDVLGSVVDKAMREKPEGSAEDIIALVKKSIDKNPEIATWDSNNKEVALYNSAEILAYTKVASRYIPNDIVEIDAERMQHYDKNIKDLCSKVERFKKDMTALLYNPKPNTTYKRIGHEEQYALLLNQLSINCCAAAKMKSLLGEIEVRKTKILEQRLLSKYVEKHAGLEHKAGVKPGETIVLVYKGGTRKADRILNEASFRNSDFIVNKTMDKNLANLQRMSVSNISERNKPNIGFVKELDMSRIASSLVDFDKISASVINRSDFNTNFLDNLGDKFIRPSFSNITENTVVADFTLPYICCSDCSPIAFIVPKAAVSLRLPADFVCLDEDTKSMAFEVSPSDGVVSADVDEGINGGVSEVDGKYVFDAKLISKQLLEKEIKFKVNDQFTDSKITVFEKPEFDFISATPEILKNNTVASVNFTVKGTKLPERVTYDWDFGDNTLSEDNSEGNPKHFFRLNLGNDGKQTFKVSLKVTNGRCSNTVEHDVVVASEIISFIIASEICLKEGENNSIEIPFNVTPANAEVKLTQDIDKLSIKEGKLIFKPGFSAFNIPIKFTVNGDPVNDVCTPRITPQLRIIVPPERQLVMNAASNKLVVSFKIKNLNGFDENSQIYKWDFGDGTKVEVSEMAIEHTYTAIEENREEKTLIFDVTLVVVSKTCSAQTFKTQVKIHVDGLI